MKKYISILLILFSFLVHAQVTKIDGEVRVTEVNELNTPSIETHTVVWDSTDNKFKYVKVKDLPVSGSSTDLSNYVTLDGSETFTSVKTFNNTTGTQTAGARFVNSSATTGSYGLYASNTNTSFDAQYGFLLELSGLGLGQLTDITANNGIGQYIQGHSSYSGYPIWYQKIGGNMFRVDANANVTANSFNGVALKTNGTATEFLNGQGNYVASGSVDQSAAYTWTNNHNFGQDVFLEAAAYLGGTALEADRVLSQSEIDTKIAAATPTPNFDSNTVTASRALTATDNGKILYYDGDTDVQMELPLDATEDLPLGFNVTFIPTGDGKFQITKEDPAIVADYVESDLTDSLDNAFSLMKRSANTFISRGNCVAYTPTPPVTGTELLTEANAAALYNEGDGTQKGTWGNDFNITIESTDVNVGSYALKMDGGGGFKLITHTISGLTIGDSITISFDAKCNTQNDQQVSWTNTSDGSNFWADGSQPTTYTSYSRTVTTTDTSIVLTIQGSGGDGVAGDYMLIDGLSIIKN